MFVIYHPKMNYYSLWTNEELSVCSRIEDKEPYSPSCSIWMVPNTVSIDD